MFLNDKGIPDDASLNMLDVGCGTGRYLKQLSKVYPNSNFTGVDISKETVEKFTRKNNPNFRIEVIDVENDDVFYERNRQNYDVVLVIGLIQIISVGKVEVFLRNIHCILKQNGYLYLQFNTESADKKTTIGYKRYSIAELVEILEKNGFSIELSQTTNLLKNYVYIFAQRLEL